MVSKTEWHNCTVEKEVLVCVWAMNHGDKYLLGKPFMQHTDSMCCSKYLAVLRRQRSCTK